MIFFKILGMFIGYAISKNGFGVILGILVGFCIDEIINVKFRTYQARKYAKQCSLRNFNESFIRSVIGILVKLALVDGDINKQEKKMIENFINLNFNVNAKGKKLIKQSIKLASNSRRTLNSYAIEFMELLPNERNLTLYLFGFLLNLATADNDQISPGERVALLSVANIFGIDLESENYKQNFNTTNYSDNNYQQSNSSAEEHYFRDATGMDPYKLLGCKPSDSNFTIKRQYQQLINEYHPDKIYSKNLPEDFIKFANYKFNLIKNAYQTIRNARKF
ncbi:MAG: DnaJ domain-containing protein [Deltaproteobacteria bacterium]|jgi:DnaJ like chaperone protein|nr:DnaJ domain-containing protein [Deltaproteobacteria bacterium]